MLSPEALGLVERDRQIPGLATVLDAEAFADAINTHLPSLGLRRATLTYLRYKPGENCLAVHRLETASGSIEVHAKAFGSATPSKLYKARERPVEPGPLGPGRVFFDDQNVMVSAFPNDVKLPSVMRLGDRETRERLLRKILGEDSGLWRAKPEQLAYKPERRYVARLSNGNGDACVLKFYSAQAFERASRSLESLSSQGRLQLPLKVGRSRRYSVLALGWLPGRLVRDVLRGPESTTLGLRAVGAALTELHFQKVQTGTKLPVRSRRAETQNLADLADNLAHLVPKLANRASRLAQELGHWLETQPPPKTTIHGDFYDKQVLVRTGSIGLLDLDEAVIGDPRCDLGLFTAHLELDAIRGNLPLEKVGPLAGALVEGYAAASPKPLERGVENYTAIGLLRLAHHPFRRGEPNWAERTGLLLDRAHMWRSSRSLESSYLP